MLGVPFLGSERELSLRPRLSWSAFAALAMVLITALPGCSGTASVGVDGSPGEVGGATQTDGTGGAGNTIELPGMGGEAHSAGAPSCEPGTPGCKYGPAGPACGDGKLNQDSEACDDGNNQLGDGCNGACQVEPLWNCDGGECSFTVECGDGLIQGDESCDDGDSEPNDGCDESCQIEPAYVCATPNEPCEKLVECGDGKVTGDEECDDATDPAQLKDGDGCDVACKLEDGWACTVPGSPCIATRYCGNGVIDTDYPDPELDEECDDYNTDSGDGCNGACKVEPFYDCPPEGGSCNSTAVCGNGVLEGPEVCDEKETPASDARGCSADCSRVNLGWSCDTETGGCVDLVVCGDGKITGTEQCDDGQSVPKNGDGCSANCALEGGSWECFSEGKPCTLKPPPPTCGDGKLNQPSEECDEGAAGSSLGCVNCKLTAGWVCLTPGVLCVKEKCGDGKLTPSETCDDGNAAAGDGCSTACGVESGWVCPLVGNKCMPKCGDGKLTSYESCDDANAAGGDGCSAACLLESGWSCATLGKPCTRATCGNGAKEADEACDDGNGEWGDGCNPLCQKEPQFDGGGNVVLTCGDGLALPGEACDDGNTTGGDGCAADCKTVETGFVCTGTSTQPDYVDLPIVYRDFKDSHPQFEDHVANDPEIAGKVCLVANAGTCGKLDAEGKPVADLTESDPTLTNNGKVDTGTAAALYADWYRDEPGTGANDNFRINASIRLTRVGTTGSVYQFNSTSLCAPNQKNGCFFPIDGKGYGNQGRTHNFHFTSQVQYWFQYAGGEKLDFTGDDDVWVFVNGKLAVDIGGVHGAASGSVLLGDENANGTYSDTEKADATDGRFGITKGKLYQITVFQAERHTTESNYKLTLTNFVGARSICSPICGDAKLVRGEVCDDGTLNNTGAYGKCNSTCTARTYCGDSVVQASDEDCDNGVNQDEYGSLGNGKCSPGCALPSRCGDGLIDAAYGEVCDNGLANSDTVYGGCTRQCQLGPRCGDGIEQVNEECDAGSGNAGYNAASGCTVTCQTAPRCGDGQVYTLVEECDDGSQNENGVYGKCTKACHLGPHCGDGATQSPPEGCDLGAQNGKYNKDEALSCSLECLPGPYCGDGVKNTQEQCDDGDNNKPGDAYGGCSQACLLGPRCGDAKVTNGEVCDLGVKNGVYPVSKAPEDSCSLACQQGPFCGDGVTNAPYEKCDLGTAKNTGTYNGCKPDCTLPARCGDGLVQSSEGEACDDGKNDGGYGECYPGCVAGARCGDGVVQSKNGETCDDGLNDGGYGECFPGCVLGARCGDKLVQAGEDCDDGNSSRGDGCSNCKVEQIIQ